MKLIMFTKKLPASDLESLSNSAEELGLDGFDLCVRDGYAVNPGNAEQALPEFAQELRKRGFVIPIITGRGDMTDPMAEDVEPLLRGMDKADVRLLKIGYFFYNPATHPSYFGALDQARKSLEKWQEIARPFGVRICCHTHSTVPGESHYYLGNNCASLLHLIQGMDPDVISAYVDAGHLVVEGEPFAYGVSMVRPYLHAIALKDIEIGHQEETHARTRSVRPAGRGHVNWDEVFSTLQKTEFDGPLSIHAEFKLTDESLFMPTLKDEVAFFRARLGKKAS